jgi:Zn-dependent M28 family amino/carboxypeptidase
MHILPLLVALSLSASATAREPASVAERAAAWWGQVETLAADGMEGRAAGSEGHRRASALVADRFAALGLQPAGDAGTYFQTTRFEERRILPEGTQASLVAGGAEAVLRLPDDMVMRITGAPPPESVDAPLVFIGYGMHLPEAGHDDFAGIDFTGKVAVVIGGGPAALSGALKSHARAERGRLLAQRGAVGLITLGTPAQAEQPWANIARASAQPGMYPADPAMRTIATPFLSASLNPAAAERLFAGSGHSFAEVAALADASRPVPGFALATRLRARVATEARQVESRNVVARLPGRDRRLRAEHVVLSAHLDGLGVGAPVAGDAIYNGALDNAAGVAALIDIAGQYRRQRVRPRRSILFVALTGEEKGLLGSRWFAKAPSVPRASIVANLNYDMALPLFPLTSITILGLEESSIGAEARAVSEAMGLPLAPDPFPDRNSFVRSDQYSFIEEGIPAVAFKFGFAARTPEAETERAWRRDRYHGPSDDTSQTVFREDEIRLHDFIAALALRIADADARPRWNDDSFFRRFVRN